MMTNMFKIVSSAFLILILFSCNDKNRIIDENTIIESRVWNRTKVYDFTFNVSDTTTEHNIYFNIRKSMEYPYQNLFILYAIEDESGNLLNSFQKDILLFDNAGKPFGNNNSLLGITFGDEYYSYHLLTQYQFPKVGKYKISFCQQMRDKEQLEGVLSVGAAVIK